MFLLSPAVYFLCDVHHLLFTASTARPDNLQRRPHQQHHHCHYHHPDVASTVCTSSTLAAPPLHSLPKYVRCTTRVVIVAENSRESRALITAHRWEGREGSLLQALGPLHTVRLSTKMAVTRHAATFEKLSPTTSRLSSPFALDCRENHSSARSKLG